MFCAEVHQDEHSRGRGPARGLVFCFLYKRRVPIKPRYALHNLGVVCVNAPTPAPGRSLRSPGPAAPSLVYGGAGAL